MKKLTLEELGLGTIFLVSLIMIGGFFASLSISIVKLLLTK